MTGNEGRQRAMAVHGVGSDLNEREGVVVEEAEASIVGDPVPAVAVVAVVKVGTRTGAESRGQAIMVEVAVEGAFHS